MKKKINLRTKLENKPKVLKLMKERTVHMHISIKITSELRKYELDNQILYG